MTAPDRRCEPLHAKAGQLEIGRDHIEGIPRSGLGIPNLTADPGGLLTYGQSPEPRRQEGRRHHGRDHDFRQRKSRLGLLPLLRPYHHKVT